MDGGDGGGGGVEGGGGGGVVDRGGERPFGLCMIELEMTMKCTLLMMRLPSAPPCTILSTTMDNNVL